MYAAIRKGLIRINGKRVELNYRTAVGDTLSIAASLLPAGKPLLPPAAVQTHQNNLHRKTPFGKTASQNNAPLAYGRHDHASGRQVRTTVDIPILLQTIDLLIVNKPVGIPVHGGYSIDTLLSGAQGQFPDTRPTSVSGRDVPQSLSFKPGPLHRLDKDTTGVLCFSRTLAGAQWFSQCLREKTVGKYYLGVVRGIMPSQLITADDEGGKTMTQCYSIEYNKDIDASLMLFKLITGKKHQIRKHTMQKGHPLAGDRKYCGGKPLPGCTHYLLHAWRLYFPALRPADIPAYIEAPMFPELETCLNRYFSDWRKTAVSILTHQTQATDNS